MQIINFIRNNSISLSQQSNPQFSLVKKIKSLISNVLSFLENHTSCIHSAKTVISKPTDAPSNLSHEILRVLDEGRSFQGNSRDLEFITFSFHQPIYDIPTNNRPILDESLYKVMKGSMYEEMNGSIYDIPTNQPIYVVPKNNSVVLEEPIYEEIDELSYDIPGNRPLYDTPNNRSIFEEPIYEEIDDLYYRVDDKKIRHDIPPPLPPRNG